MQGTSLPVYARRTAGGAGLQRDLTVDWPLVGKGEHLQQEQGQDLHSSVLPTALGGGPEMMGRGGRSPHEERGLSRVRME